MSAPEKDLPALSFGGISLASPTALAPMAALTDSVFRRLVKRQGGCGFLITEMVSAEAFIRGDRKSKQLLRFTDEERPIGGQLAGANPEVMAEAARRLEAMGFDFVDVNMGCPARKVTNGGGGSAMMRDLAGTASVLQAIRAAIRIPLTIKLRAGWTDDHLNAHEVARIGEDCGADLVSLHARTRSDQYRPGIRDEILAQTCAAVRIPVIANGDIRSPTRAREVMASTGCRGVMSGRGAVANPWLLRAIDDGVEAPTPGPERARAWILDHFAILRGELTSGVLLSKLKTFSGWYTRGLMDGARLRGRISSLTTVDQFSAEVEEFFSDYAAQLDEARSAPSYARPHQEHRP